jgi:hypothetical protein
VTVTSPTGTALLSDSGGSHCSEPELTPCQTRTQAASDNSEPDSEVEVRSESSVGVAGTEGGPGLDSEVDELVHKIANLTKFREIRRSWWVQGDNRFIAVGIHSLGGPRPGPGGGAAPWLTRRLMTPGPGSFQKCQSGSADTEELLTVWNGEVQVLLS